MNRKLFFLYFVVLCIIFLILIFNAAILPKSISNESSENDFLCKECNVLIITLDALRADHLGIYGYYRNTSPNIDSLAKQGVIFDNYISNGAVTFVSLPSLMTSLYPENSGFFLDPSDNSKTYYFFVPQNYIKLADELRFAGYHTVALINSKIVKFTGALDGFDEEEIFDSSNDSLVADRAIDVFEKFKNKKTFVWIHFISPHTPYTPPYPYNETFFSDAFYNATRQVPANSTYPNKDEWYLGVNETDYYISQYDGEIRHIDNEIKRLLIALQDKGVLNNTLIVISSDHGEEFGEHSGYFFHGSLFDQDLKVPLIIYNSRWPLNQTTIRQQVQAVDLYPSLLDILQIKKINDHIDGKSFYDLIAGKNYTERVAISKTTSYDSVSYRTRKWKVVVSPDDLPEVYNLENDPEERHDLFSYYDSYKDHMDEELRQIIENHQSR